MGYISYSLVVGTLILYPGNQCCAAYSQYGAAQSACADIPACTLPLRNGQNAIKDAGGVLARLCSRLRETTGLSIRTTVSARAVRSFHVLPSRSVGSLPIAHRRRPDPLGYRPRTAIRLPYPSPSSQRLATTPLHDRLPLPTGVHQLATTQNLN